MENELTVIKTDLLNVNEKNELITNIDRVIGAYKNNKQEFNRLVFECIGVMTEAYQALLTL